MDIDYHFPKENGLAVLVGAASFTLVVTMVLIYCVLIQMELQYTLSLPNKLELEDVSSPNDNNREDDSPSSLSPKNDKEDKNNNEQVNGRMRISKCRKMALAGMVGVLTLLTYLLLVKSNASVLLSWVGMIVIFFMLLNYHMMDEIRRQRLDRMSAIVSCILLLAMALHLLVYAKQQVADGQIHQGKARIIGYDMSMYDDSKDQDTIVRTDLFVSWGGAWGCPNHPDTYCEATVQGALCETEVKDENEDANRHRRRRAEQEQGNDQDEAQGAGGDDADAQDNNQDDAKNQQQNNDEQEKEEELEEEVEEEKAENEELEEENQELEDELQEYEDYAEDLEEDVEDMEYQYYYDDDMFADGYWDTQDWDSVWGEYACEDMFEGDLQGADAYDPDTEPGSDEWPYINIYGDCKRCEAYIVDYFSTQHFQDAQKDKTSARNYGLAAAVSLLITTILVLKQRFNPTADQEIELLSRHGPRGPGAFA